MDSAWNLLTLTVIFVLWHLLGRIISLSWHPSGTLIAAGMMDMIRIFDAETGEETQLNPEAQNLLSVKIFKWTSVDYSMYSLNVPSWCDCSLSVSVCF